MAASFPSRPAFLTSRRPFWFPGPFAGFPDGQLSFPAVFLTSRAPIFLPKASSSESGGPDNDPSRHLRSREPIFLQEAVSFFAKPHPGVRGRHLRSSGGREAFAEVGLGSGGTVRSRPA